MIPGILQAGVSAPSSAVTVVQTEAVREWHVFHALSVVARDCDNAISGYIEIGIIDGTKQIPIDSTPGNFPANTTHTVYWPCIVGEGQRIYVKFNAPTAGDKLEVYAHGFYEKASFAFR